MSVEEFVSKEIDNIFENAVIFQTQHLDKKTKLKDTGMDSLHFIELIVAIEGKLNTNFTFEEAE